MSSGGMDWAYRMIASHQLDPLGLAVVLHLGWRDAANLRTDKGIARALHQHRTSVQRATARLAALGIIARRSGQWVAVETVEIVEQAAAARRPDAAMADDPAGNSRGATSGGPLSGGPRQAAPKGHVRRPQRATSGGPMRKENLEKGGCRSDGSAGARQSRRSPRESGGASAAPSDAAAVVARLSPFQRSRVRSGQSALVDGQAVAANSAAMLELQAALRALEGGTAKRGGCSPAAAAALVGAVASAWESRKGAGDARA